MSKTKRPALTEKQRAILEFVRDYIAEHAYPPAIRDVCDKFGFASPNGAVCHIKALRQKGYLEPEPEGDKATARALVPAGLAGVLAAAVRKHINTMLKEAE